MSQTRHSGTCLRRFGYVSRIVAVTRVQNESRYRHFYRTGNVFAERSVTPEHHVAGTFLATYQERIYRSCVERYRYVANTAVGDVSATFRVRIQNGRSDT